MSTPFQHNLHQNQKPVIVLFDGVCNLCNGVVQFIIRRDPKGKIRFAALQSDAGQQLLVKHELISSNQETNTTVGESFVMIINGKAYTHSRAALQLAKHLSGAWPLLYGFIIVPAPIRDAVYRFVAKRRYRWFGRKESCMIPTKELKDRFL